VPQPPELVRKGELPVLLVVGVTGVGKTTSIAKLGTYWRDQGLDVMLAAGDTFRAAAIDQLKIWGERANLPVVAHQPGADPSAVLFDAVTSARARGCDLLIADTAGRLHTKVNLMEELRKMRRVMDKQDVQRVRTLLVLDATTGQNALSQGRTFAEASGVDGLVVAKLDGTAKGGIIFPLVRELQAPVLFVGTGEKLDDLSIFEPRAFVRALFRDAARV
jgi:fused signal recognition particle receptor